MIQVCSFLFSSNNSERHGSIFLLLIFMLLLNWIKILLLNLFVISRIDLIHLIAKLEIGGLLVILFIFLINMTPAFVFEFIDTLIHGTSLLEQIWIVLSFLPPFYQHLFDLFLVLFLLSAQGLSFGNTSLEHRIFPLFFFTGFFHSLQLFLLVFLLSGYAPSLVLWRCIVGRLFLLSNIAYILGLLLIQPISDVFGIFSH